MATGAMQDTTQGSEFLPKNLRLSYDQVFVKEEVQHEEERDTQEDALSGQVGISEELKKEPQDDLSYSSEINNQKLNQNDINILLDNIEPFNCPISGRMFKCPLCDFKSRHKVSLKRHIKLHNPEQLETFRCGYCNFETYYERHFRVHVKVLHLGDGDKKVYQCNQCSYASNYRENLSRHKKTHLAPDERSSFICHICDFQTFYRRSYRVHMEMIHNVLDSQKCEEEYKCYHCPFETRYRVNIVRHLKTHMKGRTEVFECTDCDFKTIHKTNFNTHVLRHKDPGKIKIYQCQHCSHKTFYKASLRSHLKLHMKKEEVETYKCDICDFCTLYERSIRMHTLYMHSGNHSAIEYFKCTFCDFETRYRENWRRHEKNHARPGRQDTYNCPYCSFSTIQQGRYEHHLLKHGPDSTEQQQKKEKGCKRFRAVVDAPAFQNELHSEENKSEVNDDYKCQKFNSGIPQEDMEIFQCCHCNFKTISRKHLDEHLTVHKSNNDSSQDNSEINKHSSEDQLILDQHEKIFNCEVLY
ncbi:zinc finger protein 64-like isoform X2 [Anthonomus grandis grandis]|uniref:zinc finger protein 64-like isoform X2 n=1 Tax=Anthonomus grandis grandis TaxID=2921223 RepID=UPI002166BF48|nr:zinc finger protein 64-like isoform X2 [Anthonomus grandis grandis]